MSVQIDKIRLDGGTQSRAAINEATVAEYAEAMADPDTVFPPVIVYFDGADYWLADGFHRVAAWARLGRTEIPAEIRQGDRRRAILHSVAANSAHGLRRTNDDKRRAVLTLLEDAEWSAWSDGKIARQCGVSQPFVSGLRRDLSQNGFEMPEARTVERNGTVYQQNTAAIGARSNDGQKTESAQQAENKPEIADEGDEGNQPVQTDQENTSPADPIDPAEAKARRDLAKLTPAALVDEVIGLREALAEAKAKAKAQAQEISDLKADLAAFKQDDMGRALGNAQRQARTAEGRMKEYQATAVRADRRAKILEAENARLKAEIENQVIPL